MTTVFEAHGTIDIAPPLLWSEVRALGFMVADGKGVPMVPPGRWVELVAADEIVNRPEGSLHRYTFAAMREAAVEVPEDQREIMRGQVGEIVAAFPANTFGGVDRSIRFRGNELDDIWRIRVDPDRTVRRQVADLQWIAAPAGLTAMRAEGERMMKEGLRATSAEPRENEWHCGNHSDHAPHDWADLDLWCPGGPYAAPGNTALKEATK